MRDLDSSRRADPIIVAMSKVAFPLFFILHLNPIFFPSHFFPLNTIIAASILSNWTLAGLGGNI